MKSILITGCSFGIGKTCAQKLLAEGWDVHATARNRQDLKMLQDMGVKAYYLDYTDTATIHDTFQSVISDTGGTLDALFNNGAYGQPGAVEDLSTDVLRAQFEANFFGWHELTNLIVPVMRQQEHGRIVHCSSVLGWVTAPWRCAYNASKFALEGLASTMRIELTGTGIHVSLIEPGPIATRFSENALQKFLENVEWENSVNRKTYDSELKRLRKQKSNSVGKFTLPPEAVFKKLDHALNAKNPKAHYPVTVPTHFMNVARRFLPQSMVDNILIKNS